MVNDQQLVDNMDTDMRLVSMTHNNEGGNDMKGGVLSESDTAASDACSSKLRPKTNKKGANRAKIEVSKEYNLRNKSIHISPVHDNTYHITSEVDSEALEAMRKVSSRSWADLCEEDDHPPKHGSKWVNK